MNRLRIAALAAAALVIPSTVNAAKVRDIAELRGVRSNDLIGYGLVVGLDGSGDKVNLARQSLASFLQRLGVRLDPAEIQRLKPENAAAVTVTAVLPPFAHPGTRIDVLISSIGDADSLQGGTLLMTPLRGADGEVYAVAQGPISIGGFRIEGSGGGDLAQKNHPTVGRIPEGAMVEQDVRRNLGGERTLTYALSTPSFTTASRMAAAINAELGAPAAQALDGATVAVAVGDPANEAPPSSEAVVALAARIEQVQVEPDRPAKVIINERTGTIVMGAGVGDRWLAHGNLTVEVRENLAVSQPGPFARGADTVVVPNQELTVREESNRLTVLEPGPTIADVVAALNLLGVSPRDLIAVLQAIREAGALDADLEVI